METVLDELRETVPLGAEWRSPTVHQETFTFAGRRVSLVGLHTRDDRGREATASAAGAHPVAGVRAYFELVERTAILHGLGTGEPVPLRDAQGRPRDAIAAEDLFPSGEGDAYRISLSNGVGAHRSWPEACRSARAECIERDRVLRSWYFGTPEPEAIDVSGLAVAGAASHRLSGYRFADESDPSDVSVVGLLLEPRSATDPVGLAFAAGATEAEAAARAETECLQRIGFLRGEPLPTSSPEPAPTPEFHLDFYLYPPNRRHLRRWLSGEGNARVHPRLPRPMREPLFADLTPPALSGRVAVARAVDPGRMPLAFGAGHPWLGPKVDRVHPVA